MATGCWHHLAEGQDVAVFSRLDVPWLMKMQPTPIRSMNHVVKSKT